MASLLRNRTSLCKLVKTQIFPTRKSFATSFKQEQKVALVFGAGDATGAACSKAFAKNGYTVIAVRRNKGGTLGSIQQLEERMKHDGLDVHGHVADARKEDDVIRLLDDVEHQFGSISLALHNIGPNMPQSVLGTSVQRYHKLFETSATSSLIVGRECAKRMLKSGTEGGCIFFTGSSASLRGNAYFAAFASAMCAKRALAQSMAKELGPQGIHVSHVIVDGIINTPFHATDASPVPRDIWHERSKNGGIIDPESIAEAFVYLSKQKKNAWTFEMDLRPWIETW